MTTSPDCIFCKIAAGQIPCHKLFEQEGYLSFLDIGPLAEGHALLVPKPHYENLTVVPADAWARLIAQVPRLAAAVLEVTGAEGFNLLLNDGLVAGQVVPHVHLHVVPRRAGDSLGYRWNAGSYPAGRAEELCTRIRKALS